MPYKADGIQRCGDCKWWTQPTNRNSCYGNCHLNPPTVVSAGDTQSLPSTTNHGFCSHQTPKAGDSK